MTNFTRRTILRAAPALPLVSILSRPARAAQFTYKFATGQDPSHPVNIRGQEAIDRIRTATNGQLDIHLFPANQLGSDTDLLAQVRNGGVEFFNEAASILATLVPVAGIVNTGFAFADYDQVWRAMDGPLGKYVREKIAQSGIITVSKSWNNGFRQITTSTKPIHAPADLAGLKLRVPAAPMLTSLFSALGAGPTPINFNEVYTSLQTHLVEGEENPLAIIATAKLYEVQKYCSMTSHVWDGYWILGNRRAFERLPAEMQTIVTREFERAGDDERADTMAASDALRAEMGTKGMQFIDVDKKQFRDALARTSFYGDWQKKFGDEAWGLLEAQTGKLA
jgi:tripartite ATP-independent transporter DctP family solute receptor